MVYARFGVEQMCCTAARMDFTATSPLRLSTNPTTGIVSHFVTVIPARLFDFESAVNRVFLFTVRATEDGGGLSTADSVFGDQLVTLTVADVNEAPSAVFTPVTPASGVPASGTSGSISLNLPDLSVGTTIGSVSLTDPDSLAGIGSYGPDSLTVTFLDSSSATAPALTYVPNADPATGASLKVSNLSTLQTKIGKPFTVRFTIKDKNGAIGALSYTLTLTVNVTNNLVQL